MNKSVKNVNTPFLELETSIRQKKIHQKICEYARDWIKILETFTQNKENIHEYNNLLLKHQSVSEWVSEWVCLFVPYSSETANPSELNILGKIYLGVQMVLG